MKRMWLLALAVALVLGACASGAGVKTLYWNFGNEPPSLDPSIATDSVSHQVIKQIFIGLTDYDDVTAEVIPDFATSWEFDTATNVWTFHCRKGVQWTDGTEVVASDVVYSVLRTLDPATASEYAATMFIVEGAQAYNQGTGPREAVGVAAPDKYTVTFKLNAPAGYFPAVAGLWTCVPLPQKAIEKHGDAWTEASNIVVNGPYILGEWVHDDHLILVKNPSYYDVGSVKIDQVYGYMVVEASTAMAMYEAGTIDVDETPPLTDMDRIKADPVLSKELYTAPRLCTYRYGFNSKKPPLDNINVRKALASSVDRQSLIDYVLKGDQKPAQTWTCPGIFGYVDGVALGIGYPYDPEAARKYLSDAGYPGGAGFPEVTLMFNTSQGHRQIAEFIAKGWQDQLGIKINVVNQEWGVFLNTLSTDAPQVFRIGWCADYNDANNWLYDVFYSLSGNNYEKYQVPEFDALILQAQAESDPATRLDLYKQAEIMICERDVAFIPIYFYTRQILTKPYVVRQYAPFIEHFKNWDILPH